MKPAVIGTKEDTVAVPEYVARLALHVIESDPRRHPYGHHQWNRGAAIRALRTALAEEREK